MCGRYALGIRASFVRHQLQQQGLPVEDWPEDDQVRETYNFAPGSYGLVYRADVPDYGFRNEDEREARDEALESQPEEDTEQGNEEHGDEPNGDEQQPKSTPKKSGATSAEKKSPQKHTHDDTGKDIHYQLKAMKWGLIPFWTKRSPDYGSMLRTINCRDDSLIENRGMWNTMKQRKRCIVLCQGFYEWLKKGPDGKERIPHYVKRKDGQLMCFAGLWDCVQYEDSEEKIYTYTVITTDSNQQLKFLHDRMPVILEAGSKEMQTWLDPKRNAWSKELQSLLKPFQGDLECYPVSKDVGKVGNNSPNFIVPINSKENKNNIANFFGNAKKMAAKKEEVKKSDTSIKVEHDEKQDLETVDHDSTEDHAPVPIPKSDDMEAGIKRSFSQDSSDEKPAKLAKTNNSPAKSTPKSKGHSATTNGSLLKTPKKAADGTQRITNFFKK